MTESKLKRNFLLNKEVSAESLNDIIVGIIAVNEFDDNESYNKVKYSREPIKLVIDTYGGECYSGMALVNLIENSETPVHTYCYGKAMSMGLTLFLIGHKRFASKRATFMQHQLSGGSIGKLTDMIEDTEQKVKLQELMDDVLLENTDISKNKLKKYRKLKKDWYFTGEEAFELGVVDELLENKIKRIEKGE